MRRFISVAGIAALVVGCAETLPGPAAPPYDVLKSARDFDVESYPLAASYLHSARDQIDVGNAKRARGDERGARVAFMCADADARLAVELARREKVLAETRELQRRVSEMNELISSQ